MNRQLARERLVGLHQLRELPGHRADLAAGGPRAGGRGGGGPGGARGRAPGDADCQAGWGRAGWRWRLRGGPGFADGARFVELAPVSAADLGAASVARGLGLGTSAGEPTSDPQSCLRARRLVLDNFWCWTTSR